MNQLKLSLLMIRQNFLSFLSGTLWYLAATSTTQNSNMHRNVMIFETVFGPDFVLDNVFRCATIFSFLAMAMVLKTVLTIGFTETMHKFEQTDRTKAQSIVTGEKFIQGTLIRAFINGLFLLVGWGLVAVYFKKKLVFLGQVAGKKKRRRRRQTFNTDYQYLLEENFQKILTNL